jgi:hypothetical protein
LVMFEAFLRNVPQFGEVDVAGRIAA